MDIFSTVFIIVLNSCQEGGPYDAIKKGFNTAIKKSKQNQKVNQYLAQAVNKSFLKAQKTIASKCKKELIAGSGVRGSREMQVRGNKYYTPPLEQKVKRDVEKLDNKIEELTNQLDKQKLYSLPDLTLSNIEQLISGSTHQSSQSFIDELIKIALKDCDVNSYEIKLRQEVGGLAQEISDWFVKEISEREELKDIFIPQSIAKNAKNVEEILEEIKELSRKIDEQSNNNSSSITPKLIFFDVPSLTYFVKRPQHYSALKKLLLSEENKSSGTLVIAAIHGLGGIGKTTLASALAHDEEVQANFPDGVLWVTLGQQPNLLDLLNRWIRALGDRDYNPTTPKEASAHLKTLLFDKKVLLVVDDVWKLRDLEFFQVGRNGSKVLVTTREVQIVGASRYDLDVMTADESLELIQQLIENSTGNSLNTSEKEKALLFARKVGYLPLALELGAAQVADGVTWDKLLHNLQAEIVRLNKLDNENEDLEDISEEDKRKYSLVASFNLSLRRLKKEELKRFTWLAILPEDETIKETMVATLWEVDQEDAEKTLRLLRRKALLKPSYQLHDLMQDMAKELLTASPNPTQEEVLPGLGLTLQQAHSALLERYLSKTHNGLWHTLPPDGYIHINLSWHLEQAKRTDELHQLLKEETATGRNAWFEVCESIGQVANFVSHVTNAWRLAEEMFEQSSSEAISLQCRYVLIISTLNSLASNIPAELIAALVEKKLWIPEQGLAYAQQAQDSKKRADILTALVPHLPKSLLPVVLEAVRSIQDDYYRACALSDLAPHLSPEQLQQALELARGMQDDSNRARALSDLAPHLSPEIFHEALEATLNMQDEYDRTLALSDLAPHLSPEQLQEVLESVKRIKLNYFLADFLSDLALDDSNRAHALSDLAPHLSPEQLQEALEIARGIKDNYYRARALGSLTPHLSPEQLQKALGVARGIKDNYYRARALGFLASHLSPETFHEALEVARGIQSDSRRALFLRDLAPYRFPEQLQEVLEIARGIQDDSERASALGNLVPHLSPEQLQEALEVARSIDDSGRARALGRLAPYLSPEIFQEALEAVRSIKKDYECDSALKCLAPHLSPEQLQEALEVARSIKDDYSRAIALKYLAPHLSREIFQEALEVACGIKDDYERVCVRVPGNLALHLSPEMFQEALEVARSIKDDYCRVSILGSLAPHLSPEMFQEALEVARSIKNYYYRAIALSDLAPHLFPEIFQEALEIVNSIKNDDRLASVLGDLAPHLSPEQLQEALEEVRSIKDDYYRASALGNLAPHLSPKIFQEALEVACSIKDDYYRASVLGDLAPHLSPKQLQQALEAARAIQNESNRADAFSGLFPELDLTNIEYKLWCEILHNLSHHTRKELLEDIPKLTDAIVALGDKEALRETVDAIQDVCRQWK